MSEEKKKVNIMPNQEMIDAANKNAIQSQPNTIPQTDGEMMVAKNMDEITDAQRRNQKNKTYLLEKKKANGGLDAHDEEQLNTILDLERRPDLAEPTATDTYIVNKTPEPVIETPSMDKYSDQRRLNNKPAKREKQLLDPSKMPVGYRPVTVEPTQQAFDLIPLPSEGKIYPHKRKALKVGYLNAADENILTSPNLLESGDFVDVLMERKLLDPDVELKDLHSGDRNAILIWLRATGYGSKYPIMLEDPKSGEEIHTVFDLNDLKTVNLGEEPDTEGLFDYTFKHSGVKIKYKLLTIGDLEVINEYLEYERLVLQLDAPNETNHRFRRQIVEVNGSRDINDIDALINSLRIGDSLDLVEHIDSIESGIDLRITVEVPGRESIATFLPLTREFFWPDKRL